MAEVNKNKTIKKAAPSVSPLRGFVDFVRKQGVVGIAVGLAIGLQAADFTKAIVGSVITPIVDLLVGQGGLDKFKFTLELGSRSGTFDIGLLIDGLLKFLAVALVVYLVVHYLKLDRLDAKKEDK